MQTVGPILTPRLDAAIYAAVAVWVTKKAAGEWATSHGLPASDVYRISAGSVNMSFTQWIIRNAAGMALTEAAVREAGKVGA